MRVADAGPERKLWKAVCGDLVQAAQLPAKERDKNAGPMSGLRGRGAVRLPVMQGLWRENCKPAANAEGQKSEERFRSRSARAEGNTIREMRISIKPQGTMASNDQRFEERLGEELAKIDPETLQYFNQLLAENAPAVRKLVENVMDEPISQET